MNRGNLFKYYGIPLAFNLIIALAGFFFFGAGTYASIQSILDSYDKGAIKTPFSSVNSGFTFTA